MTNNAWIEDIQTNENIRDIWLEPLTDNELEIVTKLLEGDDLTRIKSWCHHLLLMAVAQREAG